MSNTDDDLDRLSSLLGAIPVESEAMTVGELDACKAALIVSPAVVSERRRAFGFPRVEVWPFAREVGQSEPCPCGSGHDRTMQFPPCFTR